MQVHPLGRTIPAAAIAVPNPRLSPFHRRLVLLTGLGWMFDAMDLGLISFVLAGLAADWGFRPADPFLGLPWLPIASQILSAGFLGMVVGAAVAGRLADRFGRKRVFQATVLIYSGATGLCALVPGPETLGQTGSLALLVVLRFLVGLGLGGEFPVASTLVSEWAPTATRGRMLVLVESFWAYGWILAAALGLGVIPGLPGGWRIACALGSLPALYVFYLRRHLPESPRYLALTGRRDEARTLLAGAGLDAQEIALATAPPPAAAVYTLWQHPFARRTAMLWIVWSVATFSFYGIVGWLPTLLSASRGLATSFSYILIINLASLPGSLLAAWLVRRWGRKPALVGSLLGAALGAACFWLPGSGLLVLPPALTGAWFIACGTAITFFSRGVGGVSYTYGTELYPTRMRGRGLGLAAAWGRFGGAIGPYAAGLWLGTATLGGAAGLFTLYAGALCLAAAVIAILGEETRGRALEEIAV